MDMSFYTASVGAQSQQGKLDIVSNNIANSNTVGFKSLNTVFSDLVYKNIHLPADEETDLLRGSGAKVDKTNILFSKGGYDETGGLYDFCIKDEGFFCVEDVATGERKYTISGNFMPCTMPDGTMYLGTSDADFIIGEDNQPIFLDVFNEEAIMTQPGIFQFDRKDRLLTDEGTFFTSIDDEQPQMIQGTVLNGVLEGSNMNLAEEMTKVIEAQRTYQYALKMVQTSDEIQNMFNTLR
ncbi:MAG: flagellar hook-basal body complex protein [Bacillota bacterium]